MSALQSFAQERKIDHHRQYWLSYQGTIKIDDKWSLNPDLSYRWLNEFDEKFQFAARAGVTRKLTSKWSVTAGYCYFLHYSNSHVSNASRHEQRPWQQIVFQMPGKRILLHNRLRTEQRFFLAENEDVWRFNHRIRYQLLVQIPLKGTKLAKGIPYLQLADEIMFNLGKDVTYNHFDQNRLNVGFGYGITDQLSVYAGYQQGWQKRNAPNSYFSTNTVKLNIIHQFALKDM